MGRISIEMTTERESHAKDRSDAHRRGETNRPSQGGTSTITAALPRTSPPPASDIFLSVLGLQSACSESEGPGAGRKLISKRMLVRGGVSACNALIVVEREDNISKRKVRQYEIAKK